MFLRFYVKYEVLSVVNSGVGMVDVKLQLILLIEAKLVFLVDPDYSAIALGDFSFNEARNRVPILHSYDVFKLSVVTLCVVWSL